MRCALLTAVLLLCCAACCASPDVIAPGTLLATYTSGLQAPVAVALDASGSIYVVDSYQTSIIVLTPNGTLSRTLTWQEQAEMGDIAVDAQGDRIYFAALVAAEVAEADVAADGAALEVVLVRMNANGTAEHARLVPGGGAQGVALDAAGNVYVSTGLSNQLLVYDANCTLTRQMSSPAFTYTGGLAVDAAGRIYVANRFKPYVVFVLTNNGTLLSNFSHGNGALSGLALDAAGNIYTVDTDNNSVLVMANNGTLLYSFKSGLSSPDRIAVDAGSQRVYVVDHERSVVVLAGLNCTQATLQSEIAHDARVE